MQKCEHDIKKTLESQAKSRRRSGLFCLEDLQKLFVRKIEIPQKAFLILWDFIFVGGAFNLA
ncbi:hypothetical protein FBQ85_04640 [Cytophagia bacterium CHB2]|nr:hypothetical protein [Cytophagia bacterium CHB2]